jgi:Family of unknown function (DUF6172)
VAPYISDMKKTFPLTAEGKNPARLLEATKHEIRKYIQRERNKPLPEGVDYWDFECQFGPNQEAAAVIHVSQITASIDAMVAANGDQFYIEILSTEGHRQVRPSEEP